VYDNIVGEGSDGYGSALERSAGDLARIHHASFINFRREARDK
jgi:hypothetical protein